MAKYRFCEGSMISVNADAAGHVMEELSSRGELTASNLVQVSRPKDAPLHDAFEWRDDVAAEKYREDQARLIIRSIRVVSESDPQSPPERVYVHPVLGTPNYEPLRLVLQDVDKRTSLLKSALRDLVAFRSKYKELHELAKVMEAAETTITILESV